MSSAHPPRFLGGYGPAAVVGVALLLVSTYVPSVSKTEQVSVLGSEQSREASALSGDETASEDSADPLALGDTGGSGDLGDGGTTDPGGTSGAGTATDGSTGTTKAGTTKTGANTGATQVAAAPVTAPGGAVVAPGQTVECGAQQVKGDPYAPPCYKFGGGNNGGSTSLGVTADTINITIREGTFDKGVIDVISKAALKQGASNFLAGETPEIVNETILGLIDYFNARYEFYGRKLKLNWIRPKGDLVNEILGGGQDGAEADAITAATEIKAFADLSALSPPYADALSRRGVIAVGAPYMSKEWMSSRAPYQWSWFTDCNTIVDTVSSYYITKLGGRPASLAGGDLAGRPRKVALVAPDSDWFQRCVDGAVAQLRQGVPGEETSLEPFKYKLDLNSMSPQAYALLPQLVASGVTTVVCACDPMMLLFLTAKAREQGFQPEWVSTGVAFTDQDAVAQIFDQSNWNGAFGVSFGGNTLDLSGGPGYRAFKSTRPNAAPSKTVEALFLQIQLLAIGIQMAGPNLTPKTFEAGMFKYPVHSGPAGTWDFAPNDYTGPGDAREIWYSAGGASAATGGKGTWVDPSGGRTRYRAGQFSGDPVSGGR